jgi:surface polysaccharide O-acyltransferase-like enzyme
MHDGGFSRMDDRAGQRLNTILPGDADVIGDPASGRPAPIPRSDDRPCPPPRRRRVGRSRPLPRRRGLSVLNHDLLPPGPTSDRTGQGKVDTRNRIVGLDMLRGIAVLLMVFGHCVSWGDYGAAFAPYETLGWTLTGVRMPVLVLISGTLAHGLLRADVAKLRARLAHFGWTYAIWMPVVTAFTLTCLSPVPVRIGIDTLFAEYVRPMTVMWFVWVLSIYSVVLFATRRLPRATVAGAAILVSIAGYAIELPIFSHGNLLRYAGLFFVGALYRAEVMRLMTASFSWRVMAMLVAGLIPLHMAGQAMRASEHWQVLGVPERFLLCAIALHGVQLLYRLPVATPLARLGQKTLPVFVAHLPILLIARAVLPDLGGAAGMVAPVILAVVSMAGSLMLERIAIRLGADWLYARPDWANMATLRRAVEPLAIGRMRAAG